MTTRIIFTATLFAILPLTLQAQPQPQRNWPQREQANRQQPQRNWPQRDQANKQQPQRNWFQREQPKQQQQPRFDPEQFQQNMLMIITREAGLTPAESQAFIPLYKEMRKEERVMSGKILELKTKKYNAEKEYLNALTKIKSLQVEMAELEASYYKRISKVISAEKMFKLMLAEDRFHRQLVRGTNQNWNNKRQWDGKRGDGKREK